MTLFVHAADIHLDSPLKGLYQDESAPDVEKIRSAARAALDNLVDLAWGDEDRPFCRVDFSAGFCSGLQGGGRRKV